MKNNFSLFSEHQARDSERCEKVSMSADLRAEVNNASSKDDRTRAIILTHRTKAGVLRLAQDVRDWIERRAMRAECDFLDDLAYTLGSHRTYFGWRLAVTAASREELSNVLIPSELEPRRSLNDPRIGFVFTGQGAQWYAIGVELIDLYEIFRTILLSADTLFKSLGASWSLIGDFNLISFVSMSLMLRRRIETTRKKIPRQLCSNRPTTMYSTAIIASSSTRIVEYKADISYGTLQWGDSSCIRLRRDHDGGCIDDILLPRPFG